MELEKNKKTRQLVRHLLQLEDKVCGLPFPQMKRVRQISSSHCGPAVIVELFSFLGVKISQSAVVRSLRAKNKIKKVGLNVHELARAVNAQGKGKFVFWSKRGATVGNIATIVNKHRYPVGVEWQGIFYENEDEDSGHYAVVTKIMPQANYMRICDSYHEFAGVDRRFTVKLFEKRWWDINVVKGRQLVDKRMMFVITPIGESWPKKIGMIKA